MRSNQVFTFNLMMFSVLLVLVMYNNIHKIDESQAARIIASNSFMQSQIQKVKEDKTLRIIQDKPINMCNDNSTQYNLKVLAYTLYGDGTRHNSGLGTKYRTYVRKVINQAAQSSFYNTWKVRIYHDDMIDPNILTDHANNKQVDFCRVESLRYYEFNQFITVGGKFWRNIAMGDEQVDVACFRDLDSALMKREEYAVQDWLDKMKLVHSMRDHPQHLVTLMAGMWCFRNELNRELGRDLLQEIIYRSFNYIQKTDDQPLLDNIIWTYLAKDSVQHDAYTCKAYTGTIPFPTQREDNNSFVGCPAIPCGELLPECPYECRPKDHLDWKYC